MAERSLKRGHESSQKRTLRSISEASETAGRALIAILLLTIYHIFWAGGVGEWGAIVKECAENSQPIGKESGKKSFDPVMKVSHFLETSSTLPPSLPPSFLPNQLIAAPVSEMSLTSSVTFKW